jgi:hypothetical protein
MSEARNRAKKAYKLAMAYEDLMTRADVPRHLWLEPVQQHKPEFWSRLAQIEDITPPSVTTIETCVGILEARLADA